MSGDMRRLIIRTTVLLVVTALVLWAGYEFIFKGTVSIETDSESLVVNVYTTNGDVVVSQSSSRELRLAPGQYQVMAITDESGVSKLITVNPLSTTKLQTGNLKRMHAAVALHSPIYGAMPLGQWVMGLHPVTEQLQRYDAQGNSSIYIGSSEPVGQEQDTHTAFSGNISAYQLYGSAGVMAASGNTVFAFTAEQSNEIDMSGIEFKKETVPDTLIGANQHQQSFVLGYQKQLFWYEGSLLKAQKIYEGDKKFDQIAYGGDYAIAYSTAMPDSHQDIKASYDGFHVDAVVVNVKNKQTYTIPGPLSSVTISPDGKYATIKQRHEPPYLYNLMSKQKVTTIEQSGSAIPYWTSSTSYLYETDHRIWLYNVERQAADLIAIVDQRISSFSSDGKGGYYATYYTGSDNGMYTITNAAPPVATPSLRTALPYNGDNFSIRYSELNGPTIIIETTAILNRLDQLAQYAAETRALRQAALDYLKSQNLDLTGVNVVYDPADPL